VGGLQAVSRTAYRISSILDALMLLAGLRNAEVRMEPLDMAAILTRVQERLAHLVASKEAEIGLPEVWPSALGYAPWVEEVWVNYITNAIKYGGRPPQVELGAATAASGRVRFWVRDDGQGLTEEEQGRLFTPFTRLDQLRVTGHGLGLSIVRRIVEKLGGEVGVESKVGEGSVFSFTLPASVTGELEIP
jgi:signal transduction histidine kinase